SANTTNRNSSANGVCATDYLLSRFAEFLKSKGMYYMKIPKVSSNEPFRDGVEFCHAIQQLMIAVRNGYPALLGNKIEWDEDAKGGLWTGLAKKDFWMWFK